MRPICLALIDSDVLKDEKVQIEIRGKAGMGWSWVAIYAPTPPPTPTRSSDRVEGCTTFSPRVYVTI